MPTHTSKTNNTAMSTPRLDEPTTVAVVMAAVAATIIFENDFSTWIFLDWREPKAVDPSIQLAMKQEIEDISEWNNTIRCQAGQW